MLNVYAKVLWFLQRKIAARELFMQKCFEFFVTSSIRLAKLFESNDLKCVLHAR